ncbi:radical SAM protein [Kitasatospora sp. NPDC094028]
MAAPFTLWVQPTKRSNLRSLFAYDVPDPNGQEMTLAEMQGVLQEMFDLGLNSVFLEGGEPFLREDFLDLVEFATPMAFTMVRTNGTLITAESARRLKDSNAAIVCVDLEGATAGTHDGLVGVDGAFERALRGARHLVEAGVTTYISTILNRRNHHEMQALLNLTADIGADKLGVLRLYPLGMARKNWKELSLPLSRQIATLDSLVVPDGIQLMQSWHPKDPNCCWQMSAVDAYGNSIGCPYLRDFANYGNVRRMSFMETWRNPAYRAVRAASTPGGCVECSENDENRVGGCRSTAFAFNGTWDAPDPYCEHMNSGVDLTELPPRIVDLPFGAPAAMSGV